MAISKQIYEWTLAGLGAYVATDYPTAGRQVSIFVDGFGNNIEFTPFVTEMQFVVLDIFGSTPGVLPRPTQSPVGTLTHWIPNGFVQIVINTTGYYQDPQNVFSGGISGDAAPYPRPIGYYDPNSMYRLVPPVYVLPEQTWDIRYSMMNDLRDYVANNAVTTIPASTTLAQVFVQYWLFDSVDALVCHRLLSLGMPITVDNVEWYKKQLLEARGLDTETWEYYLEMMQAFRELERRRQKHYSRGGIKTMQ